MSLGSQRRTSPGPALRPAGGAAGPVPALASALLGSQAVDGTERRGAEAAAVEGWVSARARRGFGHGGPRDLSLAREEQPGGGRWGRSRAAAAPIVSAPLPPPQLPPPHRRLGPSRSAGPLGIMSWSGSARSSR